MSTRLLVTECFEGNHAKCKGYNGLSYAPNFRCDCDCHRMTKIHDSATCKLGANGEACEMCARIAPAKILAGEAKNVSEASLTQSRTIPAPTFTSEWDAAPRSMTRTTERECAEYWFERGKLAGRVAESRETLKVLKGVTTQRSEQR